jgi:hypothetical protein
MSRGTLFIIAASILLGSLPVAYAQHTVPDRAFDRTSESATIVGRCTSIGLGWLP